MARVEGLVEDGRLLELDALKAMFADELKILEEERLKPELACELASSDLCLEIAVMMDESAPGAAPTAILHCALPPGYPETAQPFVRVECDNISYSASQAAAQFLMDLALQRAGESCVYDLYVALRDELLPAALAQCASEVPLGRDLEIFGEACDEEDVAMVVLLEHMNDAPAYMRKLRDWARKDALRGAIFYRIPAKSGRAEDVFVIIVATSEDALSAFVGNLRTQYVDKTSKGLKCKERKSDVLYQGSAATLSSGSSGTHGQLLWECVDMADGKHVVLPDFDYTSDLSLLKHVLEAVGLDERGQPLTTTAKLSRRERAAERGRQAADGIGVAESGEGCVRPCPKGGSFLSVTVKPNAKGCSQITNLSDLRRGQVESVHADIAAAPKEGEANKELCSLIASSLRVPRTSVSVARGGCSRDKELHIVGLDPQDVLDKLAAV